MRPSSKLRLRPKSRSSKGASDTASPLWRGCPHDNSDAVAEPALAAVFAIILFQQVSGDSIMDDRTRLYIYAFLSRVFTEELDDKAIADLAANEELLKTIGEETFEWFSKRDAETIREELNVDYNSLFVVHNHPIESSVMDSKNEILIGLQNPVMQFYFSRGYDLNLESSKLYVPDHAGIEFGFVQSMISQNDLVAQAEFLHDHLIRWIVPFLLAVKPMAMTPFYRDLCDFTVEFLLSDYTQVKERAGDADA